MKFRILGPLEVFDGAQWVSAGASKSRALLATLLIDPGKIVSIDQLADQLWGNTPPRTVANQVHGYVARLRRTLADLDGRILVTRSPGYQLMTEPLDIDANRFTSTAAVGREALVAGDAQHASARLSEALALWHGRVFADVPPTAPVRSEAARLEEERLAALEIRMEADLACGRHDLVVGELQALVEEHPYREGLWRLYMLALYRCGRQADSLCAYLRVQCLLDEELGIAPSAALRELHQRILMTDPGLDSPVEQNAMLALAPALAPALARSQAVSEVVAVSEAMAVSEVVAVPEAVAVSEVIGASKAVPRQLPPDLPAFVGRATQLDELDELCRRPDLAPVVVISGMAGVGKTALAVHWAHRASHRFPDGQLYVNLRGYDPAGPAMSPAQARRGLLWALLEPGERLPGDEHAQIALYRSSLADRRMLVILDNARDSDQVRSLLPGTAGCLVIVTSRDQMQGLIASDGAHTLTLDVFSDSDARRFLVDRLGSARIVAEPDAVSELIERCACLPLALADIVARAVTYPSFAPSELLPQLRDDRDRLSAFQLGDPATDIRAVFECSYRTLSPAAAELFQRLALHPGPDLGTHEAAAIADATVGEVGLRLDELTRAHLLEQRLPGRFGFHDLLRSYATELVSKNESSEASRVDWYCHG